MYTEVEGTHGWGSWLVIPTCARSASQCGGKWRWRVDTRLFFLDVWWRCQGFDDESEWLVKYQKIRREAASESATAEYQLSVQLSRQFNWTGLLTTNILPELPPMIDKENCNDDDNRLDPNYSSFHFWFLF